MLHLPLRPKPQTRNWAKNKEGDGSATPYPGHTEAVMWAADVTLNVKFFAME